MPLCAWPLAEFLADRPMLEINLASLKDQAFVTQARRKAAELKG